MEIVVTASHFCNLDFIPNIWIGLKSASEACGPLIPASFVPPRDVSSMTAPKTWHDFMNSNWSESSTGTGSISIKDFHWRDSHQWVASMHSSQRWARSLAFKTFLLDPARIPRQNCQITSTRHTTKIKMLNLTISQVLLLDPRDGLHPRALARKSHRLLCRPEQDRERGRRTGEWNFFLVFKIGSIFENLCYWQSSQVTAYYLWLPFLLTFCFGFAKFPRSVWRNFLENGLVSFFCFFLVSSTNIFFVYVDESERKAQRNINIINISSNQEFN